MNDLQNSDYKTWIAELKQKVHSTQIKASIAVNSALIEFYWDIGKMISEMEKRLGQQTNCASCKRLAIGISSNERVFGF